MSLSEHDTSIINSFILTRDKYMKTNNNLNVSYELEMRIKPLNKPGGKLSKEEFDAILGNTNLFTGDKQIEKTLIVKENKSSTTRIVYYPQEKDAKGKVKKEVMIKTGIEDKIFPNFGVKLSLAEEKIIDAAPTAKFNYTRYRCRTSLTSKDQLWRFDFTWVYEKTDGDATTMKEWYDSVKSLSTPDNYEVEIEFIGGKSTSAESIIESIGNILKSIGRLRESSSTSSNTKELQFQNIVENVVTLPPKFDLSDYYVTEKADGERHLLYIDKTSIKLIDSRNNTTVLYSGDIPEDLPVPLVIDGELIDTLKVQISIQNQ